MFKKCYQMFKTAFTAICIYGNEYPPWNRTKRRKPIYAFESLDFLYWLFFIHGYWSEQILYIFQFERLSLLVIFSTENLENSSFQCCHVLPLFKDRHCHADIATPPDGETVEHWCHNDVWCDCWSAKDCDVMTFWRFGIVTWWWAHPFH